MMKNLKKHQNTIHPWKTNKKMSADCWGMGIDLCKNQIYTHYFCITNWYIWNNILKKIKGDISNERN